MCTFSVFTVTLCTDIKDSSGCSYLVSSWTLTCMCILIRILLYGHNVDINQRIGTSTGDECEVSILKTMFCSYSNKTTCNFHMDNNLFS